MYRLMMILATVAMLAGCAPASPSSPAAPSKPADAPKAEQPAASQPTAAAPAQPAAKPAVAKPAAKPGEKPSEISKDYYAGKTIRLIVGIEPGAGGDLQARYLSTALPKFIQGNPKIEVTNMPGASGLTATNYMWAQEPDGLTWYWGTGGHAQQQLEQGSAAKFKADELVRVVTLEGRLSMWYALDNVPYKRLQDAVGGDKEFTLGMLSEKDSTEINMLKEWLRLPVRPVFGIETGLAKVLLAFDRKDVDSMISGSGWYEMPKQRPGWFKDGYIRPLVIMADPQTKVDPNGEFELTPDLKNIRDLLTPEQRRLFDIESSSDGPFYRNSFFPPKTPTEIRDIMVDGFKAALKDPEFVAGWVKITGREPDKVMYGPELDAIAKTISLQELDGLYRQFLPGYKSAL